MYVYRRSDGTVLVELGRYEARELLDQIWGAGDLANAVAREVLRSLEEDEQDEEE